MTQHLVCAKNAHIQSANERKQIWGVNQLLTDRKQFTCTQGAIADCQKMCERIAKLPQYDHGKWNVKPPFGWWGETAAPTYTSDTVESYKRLGNS